MSRRLLCVFYYPPPGTVAHDGAQRCNSHLPKFEAKQTPRVYYSDHLVHSLSVYFKRSTSNLFKMNEAGVEMKNPRLAGLSLDEVTKFIKERESYELAVQDKNTGVPAARKIIAVSVKASVDPSLLLLIAEMELETPANEITDEDLWTWLKKKANVQLRKNEQPFKTIFKEIRINNSLRGAASRIDDLWKQWYTVREKYQVSDEFATSKGKKLFRSQMASKLWPDKVRKRVEDKLEDVDQLSRDIRQSDKKFYDYVKSVTEEVERVFLTSEDFPKRGRSGDDVLNPRL
jgi:hypothetical protein